MYVCCFVTIGLRLMQLFSLSKVTVIYMYNHCFWTCARKRKDPWLYRVAGSEFGFWGTLNFLEVLKSMYHSAQVQRRSDYHYRDLVLGVYSKVGNAGTFPEAIDANNYLVTKLCCRHLRPNPYT